MNTAFVTVNQVPTKILTWGKWIEESFRDNERKEVVIVMTGNPGIVDYYELFCETIHSKTGLPVWCIGHAGHQEPESSSVSKIPPLETNRHLFDVSGQIQHKVAFLDTYVPGDVKIHLIGHSMGSYIITQLIKDEQISQKIIKSYLLFPTIEYIGATPNGQFYQKLFPRFSTIILFLTWFFTILPLIIQKFLIWGYGLITSTPKLHLSTIRSMITPSVLGKVFFLASDEMGVIQERENAAIERNVAKMRFYFGATDGWAPTSYCDKLKRDIPNVDAMVCQRGFWHEFVRNNSTEVGLMLSTWIGEEQA